MRYHPRFQRCFKSDEKGLEAFSLLGKALVDKLFSKTLWHPTARMRFIQFLFLTYGIDEVAEAIKEKKEALQAQ